MSDLESYVKNKVINGHCDCMFLYNTYQWDWTTIAAMIAPRPLLFANSDSDTIFPMDGNRRVIAKLRKIYGMYDKPNLVDEYVSPGGHAYRPDLRVAVFKFLNKHLKGDTTTPVEDRAKYTPHSKAARAARSFPEETDLPKDALNERIDEVFIPQAKVKLPEKGKFEEWKKDLLDELRSKVFRGFKEIPAAKVIDRGIGHAPLTLYQTESELGVFAGFGIDGKNRPKFTIIVQNEWPDDDRQAEKVLQAQQGLWKIVLEDYPAIYVWPRGAFLVRDHRWSSKSPPNSRRASPRSAWSAIEHETSLGCDCANKSSCRRKT